MQHRSRRNRHGIPAMWRDLNTLQIGQPRDFKNIQKATYSSNIGVKYICGTCGQNRSEMRQAALFLARHNLQASSLANFGEGFNVVPIDGFLKPVRTLWGDQLRNMQGCVWIILRIQINHKINVIANRISHSAHAARSLVHRMV